MVNAGPLSIDVDLGALDALKRGFAASSQRSLLSAFKAEAFRLKKVSEDRLRAGVGPTTTPLSQAEQKMKSSAALSQLGRFVAYVVEQQGLGIEARIGLSQSVTRAKNAEGRRRQLVALLGGGNHPISRGDQAAIAYKLRRRLREPVRSPTQAGPERRAWYVRRGRYEAGRKKWADLGTMIPRAGSTLVWPERNVIAQTVAAERARSVENVARLYAMALRGERWAKDWYK